MKLSGHRNRGRSICLAIWVAGLVGLSWAQAKADQWSVLDTKYLVIRYQSLEDLEEFDSRIEFEESAGVSGFFTGSNTGEKSEGDGLKRKLDALFEKVQLILDMRKPIKVTVNLYPSAEALHEAYFQIYKKQGKLRAWYIYEYNTIYMNVTDLKAGMLAHECAHAIVDNFLSVRPPRASSEILARYVDSALFKEVKAY